MAGDRYLGYRGTDANTAFAKYFQPQMAPLPSHVVEALQHGPQAGPTLLAFHDAACLADQGDQQTENGYGVLANRSIGVAVLTDMPGVTVPMWSWWFGWHGSDSRRYKLWHPRAHLFAQWHDGDDAGRRGAARYVGRTSLINEYIGSTLHRAAIQFVPPSTLGLPDDGDALSVCARLGSSDVPLDVGWFVHQIRPTAEGAQMRSRFWLGGPYVQIRKHFGVASPVLRPIVSRAMDTSVTVARDLMVHCAQEMNHLAGFLPQLYAEFRHD
ncbi:MAG: hypothetical protein K2Q25_05280 [Mycobacteriaceae bacterium]|nr:hypothetical protein [Mycobacteriaceae bacterium]